MTAPFESFNCPRNAPVVRLKALMVPSPKLPIRSAPGNAPNVAGGNRRSPWCVQRSLRGNAPDEAAIGVKKAHKSSSGSVNGIVSESILLRVGHHHLVVGDDVNSERGKPGRKCWIHERCSKEGCRLKRSAIRFHASGVEVRGENELAGVVFNEREARVHSPRPCIVHGEDGVGVHAIPSGDGSVLGVKDKKASPAIDVRNRRRRR